MKRKILLFTLGAVFLGCTSITSVLKGTSDSPEMDYTYLALGDSYTIGESVDEENRWPVQLVEELRRRGYKVAPPKIIAQTGWTTLDLLNSIDSQINVHREFDLVSILIGVNNQYQDNPLFEYENQLREIFRTAIYHCKTREKGVFALSIPDYGATPFGEDNAEVIGEEVDEYNEVFRRVAEEYDVDFYNITPITREAANDPDLIATDSLHPSALMYRYWVEHIIDEVVEKLPEK